MSVPHSGTRTLLEHTGLHSPPQHERDTTEWSRRPNWLHFGVPHHQGMLVRNQPFAHIPIRHPYGVCESWVRRYLEGNPVAKLINAYNAMFKWVEEHDVTFYRMEDLPKLAGTDDVPHMQNVKHLTEFYNVITHRVVEPHRDFFARYYEDLSSGT